MNLEMRDVVLGLVFVIAMAVAAVIGAPSLALATSFYLFYLLSKYVVNEEIGALYLVNSFLELLKLLLAGVLLSFGVAKGFAGVAAYTKYIDLLELLIVIVAVVATLCSVFKKFYKSVKAH